MNSFIYDHFSATLGRKLAPKIIIPPDSSQRDVTRRFAVTLSLKGASGCIPAAPILLPMGHGSKFLVE
ncbi:hypothetical protein OWV82_021811 [Melia azedarach]|uniref:Uncharacterized protein n=1 Tax=Melia azedarach TaxID=155640 RepID=A0ACC1X0G7_MELAZ|nr:hypothetical protein OWV82_021811 [Melia azedarach]